ncbi:MAG TPA: right-handed parallel beta-helix repeat-containing protein [Thermoplasmata archaeon]|nr:right-handed parallel beta-helix repeat-containing protein [Thermoplasmata archaeon]
MLSRATVLAVTALILPLAGLAIVTPHTSPMAAPGSAAPQAPTALGPTVPALQPGPAHRTVVAPSHSLSVTPSIAASVTIIRPDGSVSNLSAPIAVSSNTYTLTAGFTGAILDERNNSILDGAGKQLNQASSASWAIEVYQATNVTVQNFVIVNETSGIYTAVSENVLIQGNHISGTGYALDTEYSAAIVITNNVGTGTYGTYFYAVTGLTVTQNAFNSSYYGVYLYTVSEVDIAHNQLDHTQYGIYAEYTQAVAVWGNNYSWATSEGLYLYQVTGASVSWNNASFSYYPIDAEYSANIVGASDAGEYTYYALYLYQDQNVNFSGLNFPHLLDYGVYAEYSDQVSVTASVLTYAAYDAVYTYYLQGGTFTNDNFSYFVDSAVYAEYSGNLLFANNMAGFAVAGGSETFYTYEDAAVRILHNWAPAGTYGVDDEYSLGLTITSNVFANASSEAIYLYYDSNVSATSNDLAASTSYGIYGYATEGLSIAWNNLSYSGDYAVYLDEAASVVATNNDASHAANYAFEFDYVNGAVVQNNNASLGGTTSTEGVYFYYVSQGVISNNSLTSTGYALDIEDSSGIQAWANNASSSYEGLYLDYSSGVTITNTQFWNENYAFYVYGNSGAWIYHNDFSATTWENGNGPNLIHWDAGYPGGGNFWGNHTGPDTMRGPGQNVTGADGIVDTPFLINATNVDHYPLANPWTQHTIRFTESGLASGTAWTVTVNGTAYRSTTATLDALETYAATQSTYGYVVGTVGGYRATPASGVVAPLGLDASVSIAFSTFNYNVTFTETGLASGAVWNVTLGSRTVSTTNASLVIGAPNGTWSYHAWAGSQYTASPSSGTVNVSGGPKTVAVTFHLVTYTVTFTESGLASGTTWSVTLGGSTQSSGTSTITFSEPNGTYAYTVGSVSGYAVAPSGGGQVGISGGASSVTVVFSSTSATTTSGITSAPVAYGLLIGVILLAILAALGFILWARARRGKPPAAAPWSGPGSSTPPPGGSAPPPGGSAPPPGASG